MPTLGNKNEGKKVKERGTGGRKTKKGKEEKEKYI
jgi:hypothetical protein